MDKKAVRIALWVIGIAVVLLTGIVGVGAYYAWQMRSAEFEDTARTARENYGDTNKIFPSRAILDTTQFERKEMAGDSMKDSVHKLLDGASERFTDEVN